MLVIPLTGNASRPGLPIVTLSLIFVNCIIFFIFQNDDYQSRYNAEKYYFKSGLALIEVGQYVSCHYSETDQRIYFDKDGNIKREKLDTLREEMDRDIQFIKKLINDEIITPDQPDYPHWKELRRKYDKLSSKDITMNYGFRPAYHRPVTFFTYMFLHGGLDHLLGNMIFLWLMGCILEMGGGKGFYTVLYMGAGLGSVLLFWLVYSDSVIPLIGASGAIAGLMGAFAVLYGRKRVRIFYSLGFYFNYLNLKAIYLLPFWVANELYQQFFGGISHVAYVGHVGGLVSGAAFGLINLKFMDSYDPHLLDPVSDNKSIPLVEKGLDLISRLDLEKGSALLEEALALDPENIRIMVHLFNVRKIDANDGRFHKISRRLLEQLTCNSNTFDRAKKIYNEYMQLDSQHGLPDEIHLRMCEIFSTTGSMEKAEGILAGLIKNSPRQAGIPGALLKLANGYRRRGKAEKCRRCLSIILSRYPYSDEATIAATFAQEFAGRK